MGTKQILNFTFRPDLAGHVCFAGMENGFGFSFDMYGRSFEGGVI